MGGGGSRYKNYIPPEKIDRDHEGQSWLNKTLEEVTELIEKDKNNTVFLDRVSKY